MTGNITGLHVLLNSVTVLKEFGPRCYLRCLKAMVLRERRTFLEIAFLD